MIIFFNSVLLSANVSSHGTLDMVCVDSVQLVHQGILADFFEPKVEITKHFIESRVSGLPYRASLDIYRFNLHGFETANQGLGQHDILSADRISGINVITEDGPGQNHTGAGKLQRNFLHDWHTPIIAKYPASPSIGNNKELTLQSQRFDYVFLIDRGL